MAAERDYTLPAAWAEDAQTTIPPTPVTGESYRDEAIVDQTIKDGHVYNVIADSSEANQYQYLLGLLGVEFDKRGIPGWSDVTVYDLVPAFARGSDGNIYKSTAANGPGTGAGVTDPVGDVTGTWVEQDLAGGSPTGYKSGVSTAPDGGDPDHDIDFGPFNFRATDDSVDIKRTTNIIKQIDATWAEGNNQGGLADGLVLSANTWYLGIGLGKASGGEGEVGWDVNVNGTNLLVDANVVAAGYTKAVFLERAFLTDGASNIIAYFEKGRWQFFDSNQADFSSGAPSAVRVPITVSVPPVEDVIGMFWTDYDGNSPGVDLFNPDSTDNRVSSFIAVSNETESAEATLIQSANNASQIDYAAFAGSSILAIETVGFMIGGY